MEPMQRTISASSMESIRSYSAQSTIIEQESNLINYTPTLSATSSINRSGKKERDRIHFKHCQTLSNSINNHITSFLSFISRKDSTLFFCFFVSSKIKKVYELLVNNLLIFIVSQYTQNQEYIQHRLLPINHQSHHHVVHQNNIN